MVLFLFTFHRLPQENRKTQRRIWKRTTCKSSCPPKSVSSHPSTSGRLTFLHMKSLCKSKPIIRHQTLSLFVRCFFFQQQNIIVALGCEVKRDRQGGEGDTDTLGARSSQVCGGNHPEKRTDLRQVYLSFGRHESFVFATVFRDLRRCTFPAGKLRRAADPGG